MQDEKTGRLGIVGLASKGAGTLVGKAAVVSKKIVALGARGAAAAEDLVSRSVKLGDPHAEPPATPGEALSTALTGLKTDLAAARHELEQSQGEAQKAQSQLAAQLKALQHEKESLAGDLQAARRQADQAKVHETETKEHTSALESELAELSRKLESARSGRSVEGEQKAAAKPPEAKRQKVASPTQATAVRPAKEARSLFGRGRAPAVPEVTLEQVQAAVFRDASEKMIFASAFSGSSSPDASLRKDAVKAMAGISHELSVMAVVAQMAREPSAQVRQECVIALTSLGRKDACPALERALADEASSVRLAAVWGLYRLAGPQSASALVGMVADEDEGVRRRAATCIGWLGEEPLAVELLPLLADGSVLVRRAAIEGMKKLRSSRAVGVLIGCLNDPDDSIKKAALSAIETITGKKMTARFPTTDQSLQRLAVRWREWWKEEHPGEA